MRGVRHTLLILPRPRRRLKPLKRQIGAPRVLTGIWLDAMGPTPLGTACERHYATISVVLLSSQVGEGGLRRFLLSL